MAREYGRHTLQEPFPTCPEKGVVVVRRVMPMEFIKLDGVMNRGNERNGKEVSKRRGLKARMIMDYVEILPILEGGRDGYDLSENGFGRVFEC
jgi:hypothetical protein